MTAFPTYSTGTVAIAANATTVVGTGSNWTGQNAIPGDLLVAAGQSVIVQDVTDALHLVIDAWPYAAVTAGTAYKLYKVSPLRFAGGQAMAAVDTLVAALDTNGFYVFVPPDASVPDPSLGDDNQYALQATTGKLWQKTGGTWNFIATYKGFGTPAPWDSGTAYLPFDVATLDGTSYVAIAANTNETPSTGDSPPNAFWVVLASKGDAGADGTDGDTGPTGPSAWTAPAAWVTSHAYVAGPPASAVVQAGETYVCLVSHTAGTFATDLTAAKWIKVAQKGSDGDMVGPGSSTDNAIVRFDGTTGATVQNSGVVVDDGNNLSTPGIVTATGGFTQNESTNRGWHLQTRAVSSLDYPVPYFRPTKTDTKIGFDIMPNGSPTDGGTGTGYCWFDADDADLLPTDSGTSVPTNCGHLGITGTGAQVGTTTYNGATAKDVEFLRGNTIKGRLTASGLQMGSTTAAAAQAFDATDGTIHMCMGQFSSRGILGTFSNHPFDVYFNSNPLAKAESNGWNPGGDNTFSLGWSGARWSSVWSVNGTIQTSDPSKKTDMTPLPAALSLIAAVNPITFKWIEGGTTAETVMTMQTVQETEERDLPYTDHVMVGDKMTAVQKTRKETIPVFDSVLVFNEDGTPQIVNKNGVDAQVSIEIPRMVSKQVPTTQIVSVPGKRTHWGFDALNVRDAFAATGLDFGGYVLDEDGSHALRPDQLIPVLWKAVQELAAKVAALESKK